MSCKATGNVPGRQGRGPWEVTGKFPAGQQRGTAGELCTMHCGEIWQGRRRNYWGAKKLLGAFQHFLISNREKFLERRRKIPHKREV